MIKGITNDFFNKSRGLIIDNSYDPYVLNSLIKYFKENHIEYLYSQDNDLSYLKYFENVKYLSISNEATNFIELNNLKNLKGLMLFSSTLENIDYNIKENLEYLEIIYDNNVKIDFSIFKSLKNLKINKLPYKEIEILNNLEVLELNYCRRIEDLNFINSVNNLKIVKLDYLPKLQDINCLLTKSKSLEVIYICDCTKIQNIETIMKDLTKLKDITIITSTENSKMCLSSLAFISNLLYLESFSTNYKIEDGILDNLIKLKDANITAFYKNYNLYDKDLPHTTVIIDENGIGKRVELNSLDQGKEDKRIIWLD